MVGLFSDSGASCFLSVSSFFVVAMSTVMMFLTLTANAFFIMSFATQSND